jgi:hypothetical protein
MALPSLHCYKERMFLHPSALGLSAIREQLRLLDPLTSCYLEYPVHREESESPLQE